MYFICTCTSIKLHEINWGREHHRSHAPCVPCMVCLSLPVLASDEVRVSVTGSLVVGIARLETEVEVGETTTNTPKVIII